MHNPATDIAAYCRVSTDKEDQLNSLETQKRFFIEYAEKNGYHLAGLYADEGLSGTKIRKRAAFQQMMADAERGAFGMLVVKDISRLARNTVDLLQSVRRLKALGIQTLFLTANMTSMGDSEFILTVFGALAQEESANMSRRIKFGKRANAEKGKVPNLVYGYDKTPGDYFRLAVNEVEAGTVRQMFRWYLEDGMGGGRIADQLNRMGLKTKRGCAWSQEAVCRILTNPLYTGRVVNGKQEISDFLTSARANRDAADWIIVDNPELRIVSDAEFRQAGVLMKSRSEMFHQERVRHSGRYPFSTLIRCKCCGRSFRRVSRTWRHTYVRWVCSRHNGQGIQSCPNAATLDENLLMDRLDEFFRSLLPEPGDIERLLRRSLKECLGHQGLQGSTRQTLEAQLARLDKQRQKLIELYTDELITHQELDRKLGESKATAARLESELRLLRGSQMSGAQQEALVRQALENPNALLSVRNLNNAQLRQLIDRIEAGPDGSVDVYLLL